MNFFSFTNYYSLKNYPDPSIDNTLNISTVIHKVSLIYEGHYTDNNIDTPYFKMFPSIYNLDNMKRDTIDKNYLLKSIKMKSPHNKIGSLTLETNFTSIYEKKFKDMLFVDINGKNDKKSIFYQDYDNNTTNLLFSHNYYSEINNYIPLEESPKTENLIVSTETHFYRSYHDNLNEFASFAIKNENYKNLDTSIQPIFNKKKLPQNFVKINKVAIDVFKKWLNDVFLSNIVSLDFKNSFIELKEKQITRNENVDYNSIFIEKYQNVEVDAKICFIKIEIEFFFLKIKKIK
jgi:hypothetical protein